MLLYSKEILCGHACILILSAVRVFLGLCFQNVLRHGLQLQRALGNKRANGPTNLHHTGSVVGIKL